MNELEPYEVQCPYCWEKFEILIDDSVARQEYIEDCEVCCRPINLLVIAAPDGSFTVEARHEND